MTADLSPVYPAGLSTRGLNLAAAVNVVLYDRLAKADRMTRGIRNADLGQVAA